MTKDLKISTLFDFYGNMLTEKQKSALNLYYNEDLSLGEIAAIYSITRQGIRDHIKKGEKYLYKLEEKLKLAEKYFNMQNCLSHINKLADSVITYNQKYLFSIEIKKRMEEIIDKINDISNV